MAEPSKLPLADRLVRGAAVLGRLWREEKRCDLGLAFDCFCADEKLSEFCRAKRQWTKLFCETGRDGIDFGPSDGNGFGVIEAMTSAELNASGLTLTLDMDQIGKVKVGPKGDLPWADFCKLGGEILPTVMEVLKAFPGSRVV